MKIWSWTMKILVRISHSTMSSIWRGLTWRQFNSKFNSYLGIFYWWSWRTWWPEFNPNSELWIALEYCELIFKLGMLFKYCWATYSLEGLLRPLASGSRPCEGHTWHSLLHFLFLFFLPQEWRPCNAFWWSHAWMSFLWKEKQEKKVK